MKALFKEARARLKSLSSFHNAAGVEDEDDDTD
jgi:hypothetical protein